MEKQEIIRELRVISRKLDRSPGRREIPSRLHHQCIKQFGSFNNAKIKSGLSVMRRTCKPLSKKSLSLDKRLVRIVSHLTFDGHLDKNLRMFHFSSIKRDELENLRLDVYKKFKINVSKIDRGRGYGKKTLRYWYFNSNLSKFLYFVGTPKGDKMLTKFDIPCWIKNDKRLAKEYLKIAFLCEGSKYKQSKNTEVIKINLNKSEELLKNGLQFMKSLKLLLSRFEIATTKVWVTKGNRRKRDGKLTKMMRFNVKSKSVNRFINEIGWFK